VNAVIPSCGVLAYDGPSVAVCRAR